MLAVNSSAAHNRAAFALLQKLVDQFNTMKDPGAFKLYFNKELEGFNKAPPASDPKIREVQEKLDSVTGIMRGNIGEPFLSNSNPSLSNIACLRHSYRQGTGKRR